MSKLDELIKEHCPDGVEYKTLSELGVFYGGLTGKSKEDFTNGNANFITYMNIFSNPSLKIDTDDKVKINIDEKHHTIMYGDILFTGSSEKKDECGMSSAMTIKTDKLLYLNSFSFGFRFNDHNIMLPDFSKHLFRSSNLRKQINTTANGVTRFNVSKKLMEKVIVPIPPIQVQEEIVRILDSFTELAAELTAELAAELAARKKQYTYYKKIMNDDHYERVELKEIIKNSCSGGTPKKDNKSYYINGNVPWLRTKDVKFNEITEIDTFITEEAVSKTSAKWIPSNCVIVALSGATAGRCAVNKIKTTTNQHCFNMEIDNEIANHKYVFYCLCNQYDELLLRKQGARGDLNSNCIKTLKIPLPPLEEQQRIVDILDRFDALCNDITKGLPAEIENRKKQYEYYRDKLLTFNEVKKNSDLT